MAGSEGAITVTLADTASSRLRHKNRDTTYYCCRDTLNTLRELIRCDIYAIQTYYVTPVITPHVCRHTLLPYVTLSKTCRHMRYAIDAAADIIFLRDMMFRFHTPYAATPD